MRRVVLLSEKDAVYKPCNVARMTGVSLTSPVKTILPASSILPPQKVRGASKAPLCHAGCEIVSLHLDVVGSGPHALELALEDLGRLLVGEYCSGVVLAFLA